jgi:3-oxoacyl-[acyl-carrier protein] reductase
MLTGRDPVALEDARQTLAARHGEDRVRAHAGDLADSARRVEVVAEVHRAWGRLDLLVAGVGSGAGRRGWEQGQQEWERMFSVNLWISAGIAEAVLPGMVAAGRGSIVFISSIAGGETVSAPPPYGAAKAALRSYSKALARELGPSGIRVNCVAPGNVLVPGGGWGRRLASDRAAVEAYIAAEVPMQRLGAPEEIAAVVAFLSSPRASFVTGAWVVADGGQTRGY